MTCRRGFNQQYVTISSDADAANLPQDLDKLAEWEDPIMF
jgi:hypothetical protein